MTDDIQRLREEIDEIDSSLIHLLAERMRVSREIGSEKEKSGLPALDKERWEELMTRCIEVAAAHGLTREFVIAIFDTIHKHSLKEQEKQV